MPFSSPEDQQSLMRAHIHDGEIHGHIEHISQEFQDGFEFLKKYPKSVTIFGSSQMAPDTEMYKKAEELGGRIAQELRYAVLTGGGPGIMEAANKGAYRSGGASLGLNVSLPHERNTNPYCTHAIKFSYFFSRKTMLYFAAEAYVFFPGGFGTLDELFGVMTLIQTDKIARVPIILFGSEYWNPWKEFLKSVIDQRFHCIEDRDLELFEITDSLDRVMEKIRRAQISEWWRVIN